MIDVRAHCLRLCVTECMLVIAFRCNISDALATDVDHADLAIKSRQRNIQNVGHC